jgi:hypothetical protein
MPYDYFVWLGRAAGPGLFGSLSGVVKEGDVVFFEVCFYYAVLSMWRGVEGVTDVVEPCAVCGRRERLGVAAARALAACACEDTLPCVYFSI